MNGSERMYTTMLVIKAKLRAPAMDKQNHNKVGIMPHNLNEVNEAELRYFATQYMLCYVVRTWAKHEEQ